MRCEIDSGERGEQFCVTVMHANLRRLVVLSQLHPDVDVPLLVSALMDYQRESRTAGSRTDRDSPPAKSEGNGHGADAKASANGGE